MKRQILFALEDIKRNPWYYVRFFVQMLFVLLLFAIGVSQLISLRGFQKKFDRFDDLSQVYVVRDMTDDRVFDERANREDFDGMVYGFYQYLSSLEDVKLMAYDTRTISFEDGRSWKTEGEDYGGKIFYSLLCVEQNFEEIFDLSVIEGRGFVKEDYETEQSLTPVLLGNDFKKDCSVGDVLDNTYRVVGILRKDAFYLDPGKTGEILYLNNSVVTPMVVNETTDSSILCNMMGFGTLITDDAHRLTQIADTARDMELFDSMEFISYREQLRRIVSETRNMVAILMTLVGMVLFFCMICVITSLLNYIDSHRSEFAVHLLCGATRRDLTVRLALPVAGVLLLAEIPVAVAVRDTASLAATVLFGSLLLAGVITLPAIRIMRKEVADFLREDQHD